MLVNKVDIARRLIIRPGAIGDFIVSLPALVHLRTAYTEVWTAEANLPLVRFADVKRSIVSAGLDRFGLLNADDVIARLRAFDAIVSWYGAGRPDFRDLVCEAGLPFEFHAALPQGMHAVDYYAAQVGLGPGAVPRIETGPVERHGAVVVHPFASSPGKRLLSPNAGRAFPDAVTLRGPEEELAGSIFMPDLFDLAKFIAGARAYIGNDSGITHLAAAVGTPTVAVFGPTDPAVWGPRGPRVRIVRSPDAVADALRGFGI